MRCGVQWEQEQRPERGLRLIRSVGTGLAISLLPLPTLIACACTCCCCCCCCCCCKIESAAAFCMFCMFLNLLLPFVPSPLLGEFFLENFHFLEILFLSLLGHVKILLFLVSCKLFPTSSKDCTSLSYSLQIRTFLSNLGRISMLYKMKEEGGRLGPILSFFGFFTLFFLIGTEATLRTTVLLISATSGTCCTTGSCVNDRSYTDRGF